MKPPVNILATCTNPELLEATLLVFKTIRNGFPTAKINVFGNGLSETLRTEVAAAAINVGATWTTLVEYQTHDEWISWLMQIEHEPFWICDTDMVFFDTVEDWPRHEWFLAGRKENEFLEEWTKSVHVERLHSCLLYLNPTKLWPMMRQWCKFASPNGFPTRPQTEFIKQQFIPRGNRPMLFYDCCAGLYQAFGGYEFTQDQNDCFEHLHCGTYSDKLEGKLSVQLGNVHKQIFKDPTLAKGMQHQQNSYYNKLKT